MKIPDIKKIRFKKIIYPASTGIMIAAAVFAFIYSARFLSASFNKAFSINGSLLESKITKLDLETFELVKRKFENQPIVQVVQQTNSSASSSAPSESASAQEMIAATSSTSVSGQQQSRAAKKSELKIIVLNASGKKGAAGELKEILIKDGFALTEADNASKINNGSTLKMKPDKKDFTDAIKELIKKYDPVSVQDLEAESKYDAIITIGK